MTLNFPSFSILLLFTTPAAAAAAAASAGQTIDIKVELPPATSDGAQAQLDVLDDLGRGGVVTDERRVARRPRRVPLDAVGVARGPLRLPDRVVAHHEVLQIPLARRVCRKLDPPAAHVSGVAPRDDVFPPDVVREGSEVGEEAVDEAVLDLQDAHSID